MSEMTTDEGLETPPVVPQIGIVKGNPDDAEVAAVVAVLAAASAAGVAEPSTGDRPLAGGWKSYYRTLRREIAPGQGAWRNTYRLG